MEKQTVDLILQLPGILTGDSQTHEEKLTALERGLAHLCTTPEVGCATLRFFEEWAPRTIVSGGFSVVPPGLGSFFV